MILSVVIRGMVSWLSRRKAIVEYKINMTMVILLFVCCNASLSVLVQLVTKHIAIRQYMATHQVVDDSCSVIIIIIMFEENNGYSIKKRVHQNKPQNEDCS